MRGAPEGTRRRPLDAREGGMPLKQDGASEGQEAGLCDLVTRAYLAGAHTSRAIWSQAAGALDALCDEEPPLRLASDLLAASVRHPMARAVPRDPVHALEVLAWLRGRWGARGWKLPPGLREEEEQGLGPPLPPPPELSYKTYLDFGAGRPGGVTLLESVGGIVHNTTGLTAWGGGAVLAGWAADSPALLSGRRVTELGSGVGLVAASVLAACGRGAPASYLATDCHHHVLSLLHHNLTINLAPSLPEREELEKFQRKASLEVALEEVEAGEVVTWRPPLPPASPPAPPAVPVAVSREDLETEVSVMQVDWRLPPRLPPTDLLLASDVVYARHLIPPLVSLIRSVLDGSASRPRSDEPSGSGPTCGEGVGRREREAFVACTRRNQETVNEFLEEVRRRGLRHSLVYQATLDARTALFLYNEAHLPVKIFRITLPQER